MVWALPKPHKTFVMIKNQLLLFVRNLKRRPLFSLINLSGLTVSMAATLLIYLYVNHELSYDSFHPNADRLYRVNQTFIWAEDDKSQFSRTGPGVAVALREELPDVELVTSLHTPGSRIISYTRPSGEVITFEEEGENILAADTNFFKVFNFPLITGNEQSAFKFANTLMMTESTAKKYFGNENPVGKMVRISGDEGPPETFEVIGVLQDVPDNSTIKFNVLLSMRNFPVDRLHWSWVWTQLETFVLFREGADMNAVSEKLVLIPKKRAEETLRRVMGVSFDEYVKSGKTWELFLQPINTLHLPDVPVVGSFSDAGSVTVIRALIGAAVLILLLSCINFTNLSTAQFAKRMREASVRKVLGLGRVELGISFFTEALLFCAMAAVIALAMIQVFAPVLNQLTQKDLAIDGKTLPQIIGGLAVLVLLMAITSGIYPATFLTSFRPTEALKGKLTTGKKGRAFRNSLVVFQFAISIFLITSTATVYQQLSFMHQKDVGFLKENLITIRHLESVKNEDELVAAMTTIPGVVKAAACSTVPPYVFGGDVFTAEGYDGTFNLNYNLGDENYLPTLGLKLVLGRNFSKDQPYDKYRVIVNEATIRRLGWPMDESILGRKIRFPGQEEGTAIVGVVSDFNYWSLEIGIEPMGIFHIDHEYLYDGPRRQIAVRVDPSAASGLPTLISRMNDKWKQHAGDVPFDHGFVEEDFAETFSTHERFANVLVVMATLAILIACFGLLGVIVYALEQRTKEIGIRKVSGASVMDILKLITRSFVNLVLIAFLIGAPVAYLAMDNWLSEFAYRTELSAWIFGVTGLGTLAVAVLITSYHSLKAALTNPVDVLKDE